MRLPQRRRFASCRSKDTPDDRGKHDYNVDLSARRAKSVMNQLIQRVASRLIDWNRGWFWSGSSDRRQRNARGRERNRRVEFLILDPASGINVKTLDANQVAVPDSPDQSDTSLNSAQPLTSNTMRTRLHVGWESDMKTKRNPVIDSAKSAVFRKRVWLPDWSFGSQWRRFDGTGALREASNIRPKSPRSCSPPAGQDDVVSNLGTALNTYSTLGLCALAKETRRLPSQTPPI